MHDPEKASQSGVEQDGRPMPRSGILLGKVNVVEERGATVKKESTSRARAAASRKRSYVDRSRLSSNLPTIVKAAIAAGLLLVSLLAIRLITCFDSLRLRHAGPREVFSGVTSRKLAERRSGEVAPLVLADGGEYQDSSPEPSPLGFRNYAMMGARCLDSLRVYGAGPRPPGQELESSPAPLQEGVLPVTARDSAQELRYVTVMTGEEEEESVTPVYRVVMPATPTPTGTANPQANKLLDRRRRRLWWSNLTTFVFLGVVGSTFLSGAACIAKELAFSGDNTFDSRYVIPGCILLGIGTLVLIAAGINTLLRTPKRAGQHGYRT